MKFSAKLCALLIVAVLLFSSFIYVFYKTLLITTLAETSISVHKGYLSNGQPLSVSPMSSGDLTETPVTDGNQSLFRTTFQLSLQWMLTAPDEFSSHLTMREKSVTEPLESNLVLRGHKIHGVYWGDFNGDMWPDILVSHSSDYEDTVNNSSPELGFFLIQSSRLSSTEVDPASVDHIRFRVLSQAETDIDSVSNHCTGSPFVFDI